MKKILVPTDFSESAQAAVSVALEIAKRAKAEIHFLHSIFTPIDWQSISLDREARYPETKIRIGKARDELKKLVESAEKQGVKSREFLAFDKGREEIEQHIKNYKHDFVVMGSRGAGGIKSAPGSNTRKVIRYSKAPVLVVRKRPEKKEIKNIVFASTFDEDVKKQFKSVTELAELYSANIHLVYINTPYNFKETEESGYLISEFIKKTGFKQCTSSVYNSVREEDGIMKFSESVNADVISLVTHGRSGLSRFLTPSLTEELANRSEIPVLSININGS